MFLTKLNKKISYSVLILNQLLIAGLIYYIFTDYNIDNKCRSSIEVKTAERALNAAKREISNKNYKKSDEILKFAIVQFGVSYYGPRCKDCQDDSSLYAEVTEIEEKKGDYKDASEMRYGDMEDVINVYIKNQCMSHIH